MRFWTPLALAMVVTAACADAPQTAAPPAPRPSDVTIFAQPVALFPSNPEKRDIGALTWLAGFRLTSNRGVFGGFSGMEISPDGADMLAISDRGYWLSAGLTHDAAGVLTGIAGRALSPILDGFGAALTGVRADAEGLTIAPNGDAVVSFEREHRIWRYAAAKDGFAALPSPGPAGPFEDIAGNNGLEALAAAPDGRLIAIGERNKNSAADYPGWIFDGESRARFFITRDGEFFATEASFAPDGALWLLERRYGFWVGIGMRLRRIPAEALKPGARIDGEVMATLGTHTAIDNMEGLSLRAGPNGETLIYVIADNNFSPIQRTVLLQFAWTPPAKVAAKPPAVQ